MAYLEGAGKENRKLRAREWFEEGKFKTIEEAEAYAEKQNKLMNAMFAGRSDVLGRGRHAQ